MSPGMTTSRAAHTSMVRSLDETSATTPMIDAATSTMPTAKRGSNQNERGGRSRGVVDELRLMLEGLLGCRDAHRRLKPDAVGKLSTGPSRGVRRLHNRCMDDTGNVGALGRFLTLADTAEVLNVSAGQAYSLVRSGELPAIKIGNSWRVERDVLESYIAAKYEESRRIALWNQGGLHRRAGVPVRPGASDRGGVDRR